MDNEKNVARFKDLMAQVNRKGADRLLAYIEENTDFYTAPASTKYHLCCEGGLLQHSLNVYDCLITKKASPLWGPILAEAGDESLIIMALLHDFCKVGFYKASTRNVKVTDDDGRSHWETVPTYDVDDQLPLGHGEKSVIMVQRLMPLKTAEIMAIRWHMGYSEDPSTYRNLGRAIEKYPVILALYEADLEASQVIEAK